MVGGKSLGCTTCKKRRVKCDERRPICANCERGGRYCSGALSPFVQYQALPSCRKRDHMEKDISRELNRDKQSKNKVMDGLTKSTIDQRLLKAVPTSPQSLLAQSLASALADTSNPGLHLHSRGSYFDFVPSRIGHLPLLDAVTSCLLHGIESIKHPESRDTSANLKRYGHALSLLRQDIAKLECQKETSSEELVCAVLMLSTYELIQHHTGQPWIIHASGISDLFQAWGPDSIQSDFALALFDSHYGSIISSSIILRKRCFLTDPSWETIRQRSAESVFRAKQLPHSFDVESSLVVLPSLLEEIRSIRLQSREGDLTPSELGHMIRRVRSFRDDILKSGANLEARSNDPTLLTEFPSPERNSLGSPLFWYEYCSASAAGNLCNYWGCLILANRLLSAVCILPTVPPLEVAVFEELGMLAGFNIPESLQQESQDLAERVASSLPYFRSHAPFCTVSVLMACQLALVCSSMERKQWLVNEVNRQLEVTGLVFKVKAFEIIADILVGGGSVVKV